MKRAAVCVVATLLSGCTAASSSFVLPSSAPPKAMSFDPMTRSTHLPHTKRDRPLLNNLRGGSIRTQTKLQLTTFDNAPFLQFNQFIVAANLLGFIISVLTGGSHLHLDLLGTGAFAMAAIPLGLSASAIPRMQLSAGCVSLWSIKLASFLFFRALKIKRDDRLEDTLSTVSGTATFWLVSLLWGVLCALPHSLGATSSQNVPILESPCILAGACLFLVGFLTETTADYQKWIFKENNPGKFCNVGLWGISQHPNFCGNLMLWAGIFLMNAPALIDPPPLTPSEGLVASVLQNIWRFKRVAVAALSPLFMYSLFYSQASGSFLNTQELVKQKYGENPEFASYRENVPLLFPNPLKLLLGAKQ